MGIDLVTSLHEQNIFLNRYHHGQHRSTCPKCSHLRKAHNRNDPCLSVLIDTKGATWNCKNCGWQAGQLADVSKVPVPDFDTYSEDKKRKQAKALWNESVDIENTTAERYLRDRGITLPLPPSLRFHPSLRHGPSGRYFPALLAAVQSPERQVTAVQRIFLDGPRKAFVSPAKMTLGPMGVGAVRLCKPAACLGIAEGVETALSAMQLYKVPCWAALGARFEAIDFPPEVTTLVAFRDNGDAGERTTAKLLERYGKKGRHRLKVFVQHPPEDLSDFNDELREGGSHGKSTH